MGGGEEEQQQEQYRQVTDYDDGMERVGRGGGGGGGGGVGLREADKQAMSLMIFHVVPVFSHFTISAAVATISQERPQNHPAACWLSCHLM